MGRGWVKFKAAHGGGEVLGSRLKWDKRGKRTQFCLEIFKKRVSHLQPNVRKSTHTSLCRVSRSSYGEEVLIVNIIII